MPGSPDSLALRSRRRSRVCAGCSSPRRSHDSVRGRVRGQRVVGGREQSGQDNLCVVQVLLGQSEPVDDRAGSRCSSSLSSRSERGSRARLMMKEAREGGPAGRVRAVSGASRCRPVRTAIASKSVGTAARVSPAGSRLCSVTDRVLRVSLARLSRSPVPAKDAHAVVTKALLVRLEALPGKEAELAAFLTGARSIVMDEPGTVAWFAIQFGPTSFGVYDVFPDGEARDAHLAGGVGQALGPNTGVLFSSRRSRRSTSAPTSFPGSHRPGPVGDRVGRTIGRSTSPSGGRGDQERSGAASSWPRHD